MARVTPDDVLDAMHDVPEPVTSAPELAERMGVSSETVRTKLETLEYVGKVERKDVGANAVAWWLAGTRKPRPDAPERERTLKPDQAGFDDLADDDDAGDPLDGIELDVRGAMPTQGKTDDEVAAMLDAVRAAVDLIRRLDGAGAQELQEELYEDHAGPYGSALSWYTNAVKPGLKAAIEADGLGIEPPGGSGQKWTVVDD